MRIEHQAGFNKQIQGVTKAEESQDAALEQTGSAFADYLKGLVSADAANNVNEEELFSGLISERIKTLKGDELSSEYNAILSGNKAVYTSPSGYISMEDAAKQALRDLRDSGKLTSEEADKIYSEAFSAAQLDGNSEALFDGRGEAGDPTIAVAQMEDAIMKAQTMVSKFDSGQTAPVRSLNEASNSVSSVPLIPEVEVSGQEGENFDSTTSDEDADLITVTEDEAGTSNEDLSDLALAVSYPGEISTLEANGFLMDALSKMRKEKAML